MLKFRGQGKTLIESDWIAWMNKLAWLSNGGIAFLYLPVMSYVLRKLKFCCCFFVCQKAVS